jgi:hypothetical protein
MISRIPNLRTCFQEHTLAHRQNKVRLNSFLATRDLRTPSFQAKAIPDRRAPTVTSNTSIPMIVVETTRHHLFPPPSLSLQRKPEGAIIIAFTITGKARWLSMPSWRTDRVWWNLTARGVMAHTTPSEYGTIELESVDTASLGYPWRSVPVPRVISNLAKSAELFNGRER